MCAAHFANNWGAYLLLSWLPKYLTSLGAAATASQAAPLPPPAAGSPRLNPAGATLADGSTLFSTPYAVAIVADNVGGWVADEVLLSRCRLKLLHARKCMQAVAMLVPCGCFLLLCGSTSAGGATALLAAAIAASSWSHAGYAANILDLAGGDAATAAQMWGVVNTIGTVPGIAANVVTGRVLAAAPTAAAGWVRVFSTGAATYVCGLTAFLALAQALPLPTSGAEKAGSCGAGGLLGPKPARSPR